jgi:Spy/CpxP family protein refolding chaperone
MKKIGLKSTLALGAAALAVIFLFAWPVSGQGQAAPSPAPSPASTVWKKPRPVRPMHNFMRLTEAQRQKMQDIRSRYEDKMEDLQFDIKKRRFDLADYLRQPDSKKEVVEKKIDELVEQEKRMQKLVISEYFEIKGILTPEQKKFFLKRLVRSMLKEQ